MYEDTEDKAVVKEAALCLAIKATFCSNINNSKMQNYLSSLLVLPDASSKDFTQNHSVHYLCF